MSFLSKQKKEKQKMDAHFYQLRKKWTPTFISRDINGEDKDTHKFLH